MAMAMVNNNIPFAAAVTFNSLLKDMFLHSKIAKRTDQERQRRHAL